MNWDDLNIKKEISLGEDSTRQFKVKLESAAKLAEEMCALSNSQGGIIYIGVSDDNKIVGITQKEIREYNQFISNASNENIKPAIYPVTMTKEVDGKQILLIYVSQGPSKPYCTSSGIYFVKSGSDKRKSSPQELMRMFQESNLLSMDEILTSAAVVTSGDEKTVDLAKFYVFYERSRGKEFSKEGITVEKALQNMNLANEGKLTLGGLLLFGDNPQKFKPFCIVRAVSYYGTQISDDKFKDKNDCAGALEEQYRASMNFLKNNLSNIQKEGSFNQTGALEIDERALEEAVVNALLHRDYSKNAVIRLLIFEDRVEIISPGALPNHLTVENIINGNSVIRNPTIVSFATKILPYSGIGSGIARILKNHPETKFVDDKDGEQFTITLSRPKRS
ncbi:MAG: ATP-dependent helicase [Bacteroidota bacterium]|nr:ATP-dependent helicase [Bacteroidota bacterium]